MKTLVITILFCLIALLFGCSETTSEWKYIGKLSYEDTQQLFYESADSIKEVSIVNGTILYTITRKK